MGQAAAQATSSNGGTEPAGYKASVDSAVAEFERDNYIEAREHFTRAHALFPNARTYRGLGMVEFELKHYVGATTYLEQALASTVRPLEGRMRADTEALLAKSREYVGRVCVQLSPSAAATTVDGFPAQLDAQRCLLLEVGDHVLEFRAEGRLVQRRAVNVRGEQQASLKVTLAELDASESAPTADAAASGFAADTRDDTRSASKTPLYKKWWLWTTVAVVAAGGVTAGVLLARKDEKQEQPITTENTPPDATIKPLWSF